jgi:hypothetical protein
VNELVDGGAQGNPNLCGNPGRHFSADLVTCRSKFFAKQIREYGLFIWEVLVKGANGHSGNFGDAVGCKALFALVGQYLFAGLDNGVYQYF